MKTAVSPRFKRNYRKLPKRIKEIAKDRVEIFKKSPFSPQLKTHKLSGRNKGCWAFWITYSYRIKFVFLLDEKVLFLDIGPHKIYK